MKILAIVFFIIAVICLISYINLEPEDVTKEHKDTFVLEKQPDYVYSIWIEEDSDLSFTFSSSDSVNVEIIRVNDDSEVYSEEGSTGDSFVDQIYEVGEYRLRFWIQDDQQIDVSYSLEIEFEETEEAQPFCGMSTIVFLILGVLVFPRKKKKPASMIPAFHATQKQPDIHASYQRPPRPPSPIAPSEHLHTANGTHKPQPTTPDRSPPFPPPEPPAPHQSAPHPIPESNTHEFQFRCPDCGTIIFIDKKIKKVVCPKCSHSFRIKKAFN